jgi:hypothetical protein
MSLGPTSKTKLFTKIWIDIYIHIKFVFITYVCVFNPVNYLTIYQLKLNKNNIITNKKIFFNIYIYILSMHIYLLTFLKFRMSFFQFEYFLILIFIFYCWNINHFTLVLFIHFFLLLSSLFCNYFLQSFFFTLFFKNYYTKLTINDINDVSQ